MRILIAEDEAVSRALLGRQLQAWGYKSVVAKDGEEAWRILSAEDPPRVAVLDWVMPPPDGLELVRRCRASNLPIYLIVITGRDDAASVAEALDSGADDYIKKPYNPKELRARIQVGERMLRLQSELSVQVAELQSALAERDQAQAATQEAESKFRSLFSSSPLPMMACDLATGRFWEANDKAVELYGYTREELLQMRDADLVVDPCVGCPGPLVRDPQDPHPRRHSCQHRLKNGEVISVESSWEHLDLGGRKVALAAIQNVTERRKAEQRLHLQAAALEAAENGIVIADQQGAVSWVNHSYTSLTGYTPEDVMGRSAPASLAGRQSEAVLQTAWESIRAGSVWRGEVVSRSRDSVLHTFEVTITPVHNEAGQLMNAVAILQDVTERKRAEADLKHQRDMLRILMDNIPDCIYFKEADTRYTLVNRAHATLLGIEDPKQACGLTDFAFLSPEFAREAFADEQRIVRTGEAQVSKPELVRRPGWSRWVTTTKAPVKDDKGRVVAIVGLARDVTESKQTEEALLESAESARALFSAIPHPIWVFNLDTLDFLEVNDEAVRHYGYSRDEFLRMKVTDIRPAEEAARLRQLLSTLDWTKPYCGLWKHQAKDDRTLDVEIHGHALEFRGRKAALIVAHDITDRKRLEVELQHAQKLEAVGSLASGIAHEINTPIQYVGDNVHFLQDSFRALQAVVEKYDQLTREARAGAVTPGTLESAEKAAEEADIGYLAEEVPKSIGQTLDGVERVATIVRAMKEFAHPGRKEKMAADLNRALQNALVVTRNRLKYVSETRTEYEQIPPVFCHIADLNQVFLNLLVNAADAIAEVVKGTTEKGLITVRTRCDGDAVVISVTDTGGGIPKEIAARIFEPFFTTKEVGSGTGQGLAVARSIVVEKHGGALTFESEPGKGTTFFLRLPIEQDK